MLANEPRQVLVAFPIGVHDFLNVKGGVDPFVNHVSSRGMKVVKIDAHLPMRMLKDEVVPPPVRPHQSGIVAIRVIIVEFFNVRNPPECVANRYFSPDRSSGQTLLRNQTDGKIYTRMAPNKTTQPYLRAYLERPGALT